MGTPEEIKTYKIKQVEVFSAGEWNKDKYEVNDLHDMVTAFNALRGGFVPFLKLGHDDNQKFAKSSGLPSVGWVENLYVKGSKLYADLDHIPEKVFKLIKSKAYRKVSCEIYWNLDVNGHKYSRVLGAIALLGAETPGVMNLDDILAHYTQNENSRLVVFKDATDPNNLKTYEVNFDPIMEDKMSEELQKLQAELDEQKKSYALVEQEKADAAKKLEEANAEIAKFREENAKALAEAQVAKVAKFVTELESKKLATPAMKDMLTEIMSDKKEFAIGDKAMTKEELVEQILTLSHEAAKVNFDESSRADFAKKGSKEDELAEEISKYAKDNKCSEAQAYKAVMKGKKMEEDKE
jgi:hypothetical protein